MSRFFVKPKVSSASENAEMGSVRHVKAELIKLLEDTKSLKKGMTLFTEAMKTLQGNLFNAGVAFHSSHPTLHSFSKAASDVAAGEFAEVISSVDKKLKLLEKLDNKYSKLENLSVSKRKFQKRMLEQQKRSDFDGVSKTSRELSATNDDFKVLANELLAKMEYIALVTEERKDICALEISQFKILQKNWLQGSLEALGSESSSEESALSLNDEFIKFEMTLEAMVVERKRQNGLKKKSQIPGISSPKTTNPVSHTENPNLTTTIDTTHMRKRTEPKKGRKRQSLAFVPVYNSLVAGFKKNMSFKEQNSSPEQTISPEPIPEEEEEKVEDLEEISEVTQKPRNQFVALYDYIPQHEDELELKELDILLVKQQNDDGWFLGLNTRTNSEGMFPGNYCQPHEG